ncbi:hypothetical protein G3I48_06350 [Streptomyces griseus]|uniref:hypothetical protein n=1 Tax=Streptomyces griseus TaxID=1911 RepID=UPI0013B68035|nr:hypothetical protein [Streptomyces griseus]
MDLLSAAFRKETTTADGRTQRNLLAPPQDTARGACGWPWITYPSLIRNFGAEDPTTGAPKCRAAPGLVLSCPVPVLSH